MAGSLVFPLVILLSIAFVDFGVLSSEPFSCRRRCKEPSNYTSCGCDVRCLTMGDCCVDFRKSCQKILLEAKSENNWIDSLTSLKTRKYFKKFTECIPVPFSQETSLLPSRFLMVTSCPRNFDNDPTVVNCTNGSSTLPPVESYTGIVFKNKFCALCHGLILENVCPWMRLEGGPRNSYMAKRNFWAYSLCQKRMFLHSCPNGTNANGAKNTCTSYVRPLLSADTKLSYKNSICASCHGENLTTSQMVNLNYSWTGLVQSEDKLENWCGSDASCKQNCNICSCVNTLILNLTVAKACTRNTKIIYISSSAAKMELIVNRLNYMNVVNEIKLAKVNPDDCSIYVTVAIFRRLKGFSTVKFAGLAGTNQTFNVTHQSKATVDCQQTCFWEQRQLSTDGFEIKEPCNQKEQETIKDKNGHFPPIKGDNFEVSEDSKTICTCLGNISYFAEIAKYLHLLFSVVSILCLAVVIWIHLRFPKLRNLYGFCLMSLSVTLGASFILSIIQVITDFISTDVAIVLTIFRHYIWLSVFAWGAVIIYHVYNSFAVNMVANKISVLNTNNYCSRYAIFAWGLPVPFVITGVICHYREENFVYTRHWLTSEHNLPFFIFIIPALSLSLIGIGLFFATLSKMDKMRKGTEELQNHTVDILFIALRLQLTLGIPWISFVFLLASNHPLKLPIVSTINSLQGILVMTAFVTTKKIKILFKQRTRTYPTTL